MYSVHRNFTAAEMAVDSNEREMLAARELIVGSVSNFKNKNVLLHLDNLNAAKIFMKGSPKYRLQKYANEMDNLSIEWKFNLTTIGIPRDLNNFSDNLSKCLDFEDYMVSDDFFEKVRLDSSVRCNVDRFANNYNAKLEIFNSASFCVGSSGVDSFNYDWGANHINWLFPPPRLIYKAMNHLRMCKGVGLLLAPERKSSHFYTVLKSFVGSKYLKNKLIYSGKNVFISGADKSSHFGPNFNCKIAVWHFEFDI